jgi:hypothetical protein
MAESARLRGDLMVRRRRREPLPAVGVPVAPRPWPSEQMIALEPAITSRPVD